MRLIKLLRWRWLTGQTPWLWHATFDGTRLCDCHHSRWYKQQITVKDYDRLWKAKP